MHPRSALLAIAALGIAGCGAPGTAAQPPVTTRTVAAKPSLCGLITTAQVGGAVGYAVGAGQASAGGGCIWAANTSTDNIGVQVNYEFPGEYDAEKKSGPEEGPQITPIPGMGDDAYLALSPPPSTPRLHIRKGGSDITIAVTVVVDDVTGPQQTAVAAEKSIADIVVPGLR